jgi:hypothetical protein
MKRFLAVLFAAAVVLAFTVPVQAAGSYLGKTDFGFRGQAWIWGTSQDNTADYNDDTHDSRRFIRQRYRWYFDSSFEGKYGMTFGIEWNWVWGSNGTAAGVPAPGGDPRGDDLTDITRLKKAYVWGLIPGTPAKVSLGLSVQPGLDPNNIMFASNDYFGVRLDVPVIKGMFDVSFAWLKANAGADPGFGLNNDQDGDDFDYWILNLTGAPMPWLSGGIYGVLGHVGSHDQYFDARSDSAVLGGRGTPNFADGEVYWIGLHMSATPGILDLFFHGNYFNGNAEGAGGVEPDGAYALFGHVGIRPGPARILARAWYFSGDDDLGDTDWGRWQGPDPFFATSELWFSGYRSWGTGLTGYEGNPGGTGFAGLEADWDVTKKWALHFLGGYLWFTEDTDKPADTLVNDDQSIGWEFDIYADYKIYDHLTLTGGFDYLFAGDGLDTAAGNADDAYELFWRLYYSF